MEARSGHCCGEAAEKGEGIHVDGDGAVGEGSLQGDPDQAVGSRDDALLTDGRAKHIAQEGLAACGVRASCAGRLGVNLTDDEQPRERTLLIARAVHELELAPHEGFVVAVRAGGPAAKTDEQPPPPGRTRAGT